MNDLFLCYENTVIRSHPCRAADCVRDKPLAAGETEIRFRIPGGTCDRGAHPQCFYLMMEQDLEYIGKMIKNE